MDKKISGVSQLMSRFRGWIQAGAALLTNLHLPNFIKGGLYQGKGKTVCVPGLNCYSCPAASGACPIGAFQAVAGSSRFRFSYYVTGFLILLGVLLKQKPKSFDGFVQALADMGFEFKDGKQPAFKGENQKRFIRLRSLGEGYSKEEIQAVLLLAQCLLQN